MIPIILCVAILIFVLMNFIPGDPATIALGPGATKEDIQAYRDVLGLNDPYIVRLGNYLYKMFFRLDFGMSFTFGTPVIADLLARFPYTLLIAVICITLSSLIGIPLGVSSALKANRVYDRVVMVLSLLFNSIPGFWLALLLIILFSLQLGWLPSFGFEHWTNYILPCFANAMSGVAAITRQTRSSILEVIRSDFVVTARSKGLRKSRVTYGHALPNGLVPVVASIGVTFSHMMGGTLIIETIYSIPGLGSYMIKAISARDYPAVQGAIVFVAFMSFLVVLLVDIIYAFINPRIRAQYIRMRRKKEQPAKEQTT